MHWTFFATSSNGYSTAPLFYQICLSTAFYNKRTDHYTGYRQRAVSLGTLEHCAQGLWPAGRYDRPDSTKHVSTPAPIQKQSQLHTRCLELCNCLILNVTPVNIPTHIQRACASTQLPIVFLTVLYNAQSIPYTYTMQFFSRECSTKNTQ